MAKVDTAALDAFRARVEAACSKGEQHKFFEDCSREMAARLIAKAIKRTPVGVGAFEVTGQVKGKPQLKRLTNGGTLRRGWPSETETDAAKGGAAGNPTAFAKKLNVSRGKGTYTVVVKNPVRYASYVEYGHRQNVGQYVPVLGKRLVKPWVEGQFMLKKSVDELNGEAADILSKKLNKFLKELADGK